MRSRAAGRRLAVGVAAITAVLAAVPAAHAAVEVRGSVNQVLVTGAKPGARIVLVDRRGEVARRGRAGELGGAVLRGVPAGRGYRVRVAGSRSRPVRVLSERSAPPSTSVYDQRLPAEGYGYLRTRDGTTLAINVHLPSGPGPYPTLVEYSGYGYADPAGGESSIAAIGNLAGFAVVDVNMRGTGCSGGAFDYFEPLQALDGYDVIETVARQPWVAHRRVGMMGISYGGISQLFVAARRPPSLAAITPLSVIDDTATTLYPGGILNTGFALSWAKDRVRDAEPASEDGGQRWALDRIRGGDEVCEANQVLHAEAVDLLAKVRANDRYVPRVADPLAPRTFVDRIDVPVFLACQWQDEQTGGHCPALASRFTGTDRKWFTFTNGTHIDALDPATAVRWYDFLKLYVAREAPRPSAALSGFAPTLYAAAMGVPGLSLPDDPIQAQPTYEAALAAFEALPRVRLRFDNGAGGSAPGQPIAGFEHTAARFPLPGTRARSWYLGADGALRDERPAGGGADRFTWRPSARGRTSFTGNTGAGGLWTATPQYTWAANPAGTAVSYTSAPLGRDTAIVGGGGLEAWIKSSSRDVDLQATVSEVRADGRETFVQGGWLRASLRALDKRRSTRLAPVLSLRRATQRALPRGRWAKVTVPLYYQGHVYRQGSRLRVTLSAPGGDQPVWEFTDLRPGVRRAARVQVSRSRERPSRLVLPYVPAIDAPTGAPPCPGLRGQPCRTAAG